MLSMHAHPAAVARSCSSCGTTNGQLDEMEDAYETVGVWPEQPAFHMEWGRDVGGTAMSHFWVCAKSDKDSAWPVVQMQLEGPLCHNGGVHLCTVTEALYRDVVGKVTERFVDYEIYKW